jgi:hypothetical protein
MLCALFIENALRERGGFAAALRSHGIDVKVFMHRVKVYMAAKCGQSVGKAGAYKCNC